MNGNINEMEEDIINDTTLQSIVALCYSEKTLGVACYKELTNEILTDSINFSLEDIEQTFTNIKASCNPTMFLGNYYYYYYYHYYYFYYYYYSFIHSTSKISS
jgi:hypothetical protein